ncbi:WXG100 family type VII secretion target [Streptomyces sp. NPDC003247]|uniref:WXG100 family type VII secretion target n=1 Tax=Streptomyces sp. NPDC003247 TaxID=3364677 RepID=UPI0036C7B150
MSTPTGQPNTKVTDHAHSVAANAIDGAVTACKNIRTGVDQARTTLSTGWTGNAGSTYGGAIDAWLAKLDQLTAMMDSMSQALSGTKTATATTEDDALLASASFLSRVNP